MTKKVTLYENEDGGVNRRVEEDLGGGQRSVVSDSQLAPDIEEFLEREPEAHVVRDIGAGETRVANPEAYTLKNLPGFLATIDSADMLLDMMSRDSRSTAGPIYRDRLDEIVSDVAGEDEEGAPDLDELEPELIEE